MLKSAKNHVSSRILTDVCCSEILRGKCTDNYACVFAKRNQKIIMSLRF